MFRDTMMVLMDVSGERALFARPEFRSDLVTYDLITPHAAAAILGGLHDPAPSHWVIDTIRILAPIQRETIEDSGRRLIILRDVRYRISAHLAGERGVDATARVARLTRDPTHIHLGRPRFPGEAQWIDYDSAPPVDGTVIDHGWMLHSIAFAVDRRPRFFHARSVGGVVRVPTADSPLLFG